MFFALSLIPLVIPAILFTVSWILLASPKIGLINIVLQDVFATDHVFVNVYSIGGMIFVDGLHQSPLAFLLMTTAFRAMDPALEESALMSGATVPQIAWRMTLKLVWPAALATLLILFVRASNPSKCRRLLGLPVGIEVYTSSIYQAIQAYPSELGLACAYALTLLVIAALCIYAQSRVAADAGRFSTVTGKGYRPRTHEYRPVAPSHGGDLHHLFRDHRRAAVSGAGVVFAATLLQRAIARGAADADLRCLSRRVRPSGVRRSGVEQRDAVGGERHHHHAAHLGPVLDRGADEAAGAMAASMASRRCRWCFPASCSALRS